MFTKELLSQKDNFHHAYFIEGEKQSVLKDIETFLKNNFKISRKDHPDVHYSEHQSFGIKEGRLLQNMQSMKPIIGDKKIFIIAADNITSEAQNSLLKIFEEPTVDTHFFIISSSKSILLPTLRSRLVIISHHSTNNFQFENETEKFISMSTKDRLSYVAEIIEEKDKTRAENFINTLIFLLHRKKIKEKNKEIKEMIFLLKYLKDRSSSLKLILERISLLDL